MLSFFKKDPIKKLKKEYMIKLELAMNAQRSGDIKTYSKITTETESIWEEIIQLESKQ